MRSGRRDQSLKYIALQQLSCGPQAFASACWHMPTDCPPTRQSHVVMAPPAGVVQSVEYLMFLQVSSQPQLALPFISIPAEQIPSPMQPYVA